MWCTFASQQLKLKRQLFISYHLFSAICPPLSGMLPGNISPGFDITYFPITANRSSQNEPLLTEGGGGGGGGKISVLIWMWMKRRINKWPRSSSWNGNAEGKRRAVRFLKCAAPAAAMCTSFHLLCASCFPTMVSSICSVCHLLPLKIHFSTTSKDLKTEKCCVPLCPGSERGWDQLAWT